MDINDIFKNTETNLFTMLSEIVETQCSVKAMLLTIIHELSNGDLEKEKELIDIANKLKDKELLRVTARFSVDDTD